MDGKINTLFDYIKTLCESDLDRIINFVLGIVSACRSLLAGPAALTVTASTSLNMDTKMVNSVSYAKTASRLICLPPIP